MPIQTLVNEELQFGRDIFYPEETTNPAVKKAKEYGLQYAKAMFADWRNGNARMFNAYRENILENRDYARGDQDSDQYKPYLGEDDQEQSYLNMDFHNVAVGAKFIDVTVGNLSRFDNRITCTAIDAASQDEKDQNYWSKYVMIKKKKFFNLLQETTGHQLMPEPQPEDPQTTEELDLWNAIGNMKLNTEMAMEEYARLILYLNQWRQVELKLKRDFLVDGIGGTKSYFLANGFPKIRNCDALNLILPYCKTPDFRDAPHIGEVVPYTLAELRKVAGDDLSDEDYKKIGERFKGHTFNSENGYNFTRASSGEVIGNPFDQMRIPVMEFEFKTIDSMVYKKTVNKAGNMNYFKMDEDKFDYQPDPMKEGEAGSRERVDLEYEMIYSGYWIVGTEYIFSYGIAHNVPRNPTNLFQAYFSYSIYAPDMVDGKIQSKTERMIPFLNAIQLSWLKIQQLKAEAAPKGISIEINGLLAVPAGPKGETLSPMELVKMYKQKGVVLWNKNNVKGDTTNYKPIEELENGIGSQLQEYITDINFNLELIRAVTGINEIADASTPKSDALVGTSQLAMAASNNALGSIMDAYKSVKMGTARSSIDKIKVLAKQGKEISGFVQALGETPMTVIKITADVSEAEYGIMIDDLPTDEERQWLEGQVQKALDQRSQSGSGGIDLEDAMMIRRIDNVKLAERMLICRRNRRVQQDSEAKQQEAKAKAAMDAQTAQSASQLRQQELEQQHTFKMNEINLENAWKYKTEELRLMGKSIHITHQGNQKLHQQMLNNQHEEDMQAAEASSNQDQTRLESQLAPEPAATA